MPLNDETLDRLLKVFSGIYSECQVYRVLAERVSGWKELFDRLIADHEHQKQVAETFSTLRERLKGQKQIEEILRYLDRTSH
jgi:hypothetical protein